MILADTGIWSGHFRRANPVLITALRDDDVLAHPWIIGELALGPGIRLDVLDDLTHLPQSRVIADEAVMDFIMLHRPRGIGWVDAQLVMSALTARANIWTNDAGLAKIALQFDVAWSPPAVANGD